MRHESASHRSWVMGRVGGKNTGPEMRVRSMMHRAGYRFRLHVRDLPGSPDIVLPRYKTAVFVNGCFWHRHANCRYATTPKTNMLYWERKFERNVARDKACHAVLREHGWAVVVIWECQTRHKERLSQLIISVLPMHG